MADAPTNGGISNLLTKEKKKEAKKKRKTLSITVTFFDEATGVETTM